MPAWETLVLGQDLLQRVLEEEVTEVLGHTAVCAPVGGGRPSGLAHCSRSINHRYKRGSTLTTSNKSNREWPEMLAGDEVLATILESPAALTAMSRRSTAAASASGTWSQQSGPSRWTRIRRGFFRGSGSAPGSVAAPAPRATSHLRRENNRFQTANPRSSGVRESTCPLTARIWLSP